MGCRRILLNEQNEAVGAAVLAVTLVDFRVEIRRVNGVLFARGRSRGRTQSEEEGDRKNYEGCRRKSEWEPSRSLDVRHLLND